MLERCQWWLRPLWYLLVLLGVFLPCRGPAEFPFWLLVSVLVLLFGEVMLSGHRKGYLAHYGIEKNECLVVYCSYLGGFSELIVSPKSWLFMRWWLPYRWRDVTPRESVVAEYKGVLRGLTISYKRRGKARTLVVEPLGKRTASLIVKTLVEICPDAVVRGIEYGGNAAHA